MPYWQKTPSEPHCIGHPETVYFLQLLLQVVPKTAENLGKNCQNTPLEILPFTQPPIWWLCEKFNIGAQLHPFKYRMASKDFFSTKKFFCDKSVIDEPNLTKIKTQM